jgi:hypothetical protein
MRTAGPPETEPREFGSVIELIRVLNFDVSQYISGGSRSRPVELLIRPQAVHKMLETCSRKALHVECGEAEILVSRVLLKSG